MIEPTDSDRGTPATPATSYGLLLPTREVYLDEGWRRRDVIDVAVEAERLGYSSVWAGDSIRSHRLEPLSVLAAVSAVTERVTLGTASLLPAIRQPLIAAQELATIDILSEGRLILAVGAGFPGLIEHELEAAGINPKTRFSLLEDIVNLWRALWSANPPKSFQGKILQYDWLPSIPTPVHIGGPPIWLAGITPRALERIGWHYDGWLPYPPTAAKYADGLSAIRAAASAVHRDSSEITAGLFATILVTDTVERGRSELERYCQAIYKQPLAAIETIQTMIAGPPEYIEDQIDAYRSAGANHIMIRVGALERSDHLERISDVLPGLRAPNAGGRSAIAVF
jgi:alkanesulfonate monooxygenase SsuD/methylene tetrahydromethanopterin reductase-like flavin-dependent oxidoreductase (luciferase family)